MILKECELMILFPAIDLKDGQCVRLVKGDMNLSTVFNEDPVAQAQLFVDQGFSWIHVVDLNGAFAGEPVNGEVVRSIVNSVSLPVQLGGGIRDMDTIDHWLADVGVSRVVLGTAALKNPELVIDACKRYPGKIAVGIDARGGKVAVQGWAEVSDIDVITLARKFEDVGVAAIIYTDVDRDGILAGPDIDGTVALAEAVSIPIVASGGVSSLDDLKALYAVRDVGIEGVISGRAIYDGKIPVDEALKLLC